MSATLVTIGIPTFNRLSYLQEAVHSALNQTYPTTEIIIHQNPHPDEKITHSIRAWCQKMAQEHPHIRYHMHKKNIGAVANFNSIADAAEGEFIMFIGDDDRLLPHAVETLIQHARPEIDVVFGNLYIIDAQGNRQEKLSQTITREYYRHCLPTGELSGMEAQIASWHVSIPIFASLIRTATLQEFRFREDLLLTDTEFFIRLAHAGGRFVFTPQFVSEIRYHHQRITSSLTHFEQLIQILSQIEVPPEVVPYKRKALRAPFSIAITKKLLEGETEAARRFYLHPHNSFLNRVSLKGLIQGLCITLPHPWGHRLFQWLHHLHNPAYYEYEGEQWGEQALRPEPSQPSTSNTSVMTS